MIEEEGKRRKGEIIEMKKREIDDRMREMDVRKQGRINSLKNSNRIVDDL